MQNQTVSLLQGDSLTILKTLPDRSVHCVVFSPPYYGLRDYGTAKWTGGDPACDHNPGNQKRVGATTLQGGTGTAGHQQEGYRETCPRCGAVRIDKQLGLEKTPEEYVARMVEICGEVWRVLRDDGTMWINLGDSYWGGKGENGSSKARRTAEERGYKQSAGTVQMSKRPTDGTHESIKPKDLIGIPWMVAFALRADGWYLRSDIIWHKPNPMPESVTDRPTKAHEYIFLMSKSQRYFYDAEAIREPNNGRNRRDVWTVTTKPYKGAHFATFPEDLVEPCIQAGTSARGVCPQCGAPWKRDITKVANYEKRQDRDQPNGKTAQVDSSGWRPATITDNGWRPTCICEPTDPIPATVLDIFNGSGTTGAVALCLGRSYIGIELNPKYIALSKERLAKVNLPLMPEGREL
jgi:DNA modification methylase